MAIVIIGEPFVKDGKRQKYVKAKCDCGKEFELRKDLISSQVSCGRRCGKHGQSGSGAYRTWLSMKYRCENPSHDNYRHYGGKGITVCVRWQKFENFLEDMGHRPAGHSIDRIDNSKNYEPKNCRWSTSKEQCRNKTNNHLFVIEGTQVTMAELVESSGIPRGTILNRLRRGWSIEKAISEPSQDVSERRLTVYGKTMPLSEWCKISNEKIQIVRDRVDKKWSHKEAIFGKLKT
jgi:hypothetical protein